LRVDALWLLQGKGSMEPVPASQAQVAEPGRKGAAGAWPFERITPQVYWDLSLQDRQLVENTVLSLIASLSSGE
jgi:hypothetical protein